MQKATSQNAPLVNPHPITYSHKSHKNVRSMFQRREKNKIWLSLGYWWICFVFQHHCSYVRLEITMPSLLEATYYYHYPHGHNKNLKTKFSQSLSILSSSMSWFTAQIYYAKGGNGTKYSTQSLTIGFSVIFYFKFCMRFRN